MKPPRHATLTLLLVVAACATGPDNPDLSGRWDFSAPELRGVQNTNIVIGVTQARLTLVQSGMALVGSYDSMRLRAGNGPPGPISSGLITGGAVRGDSVRFDFDNGDMQVAGRRSGRTVSGTATIADDVLSLSGPFTMVRR